MAECWFKRTEAMGCIKVPCKYLARYAHELLVNNYRTSRARVSPSGVLVSLPRAANALLTSSTRSQVPPRILAFL